MPFVIILSAPSGGGKTTIAKALLAGRTDVGYSTSATTRPPRAGERDGTDYFFLSDEEFAGQEAAGAFLETAPYGGFRYGTLRAEVDRVLGEGRHVIMDIEVRGARMVRERAADVVSIFIIPPSAEVLRGRLGGRQTEDAEAVRVRMRHAIEEVAEAEEYDYIVVNDDRDRAIADVASIIDAEGLRPHRSRAAIDALRDLRDALGR